MIKIKNNTPGFVKWAGGKKQLLSQFEKYFPKTIDRYIDPFVGGGAVMFYILKNYKPKEVIISDINEELINAYEVIKTDVEALILLLKKHKQKHNSDFYYKIRVKNPKLLSKIERAARFIYLNKTCFNGLYRVNSKGEFNVPIGSYKNPAIYQENELREISKLLNKVRIKLLPFEKIIKYIKKNDFIYFDPPYYPLKKGKNFTSYTKDKFLEKEQQKLAELFKEIDKKGCKTMLSNSDTEFIRNLYRDFNLQTVKASRMINCNGQDRGKINEIVVTNFSTEEQKRLYSQRL